MRENLLKVLQEKICRGDEPNFKKFVNKISQDLKINQKNTDGTMQEYTDIMQSEKDRVHLRHFQKNKTKTERDYWNKASSDLSIQCIAGWRYPVSHVEANWFLERFENHTMKFMNLYGELNYPHIEHVDVVISCLHIGLLRGEQLLKIIKKNPSGPLVNILLSIEFQRLIYCAGNNQNNNNNNNNTNLMELKLDNSIIRQISDLSAVNLSKIPTIKQDAETEDVSEDIINRWLKLSMMNLCEWFDGSYNT
jgi:hypothetical protein